MLVKYVWENWKTLINKIKKFKTAYLLTDSFLHVYDLYQWITEYTLVLQSVPIT